MLMKPTRDYSSLFTRGLIGVWLLAVALPLVVSLLLGQPGGGIPLAGVVLWFALLRAARWLSPPVRADALMRRGKYAEALALCDQALAARDEGAWTGGRRLIWLNRRTSALLGAGRAGEALVTALEAMEVSADPETLGNCAMALVRLNRYDEAIVAARLALSLSRERSVVGNAALALALLARGLPAEAEALARAGLEDATSLLPFVRPEHYALCLAALCRALRAQNTPAVLVTDPSAPGASERPAASSRPLAGAGAAGRNAQAARYLDQLRYSSRGSPYLHAIALLEEADALAGAAGAEERLFSLLAEAHRLAPEYALWFVAQPATFDRLRADERLAPYLSASAARIEAERAAMPNAEVVALEMANARASARPRPAPQSSREAMLVQVATLAGTFALLLIWAYRFFIAGA
jgi:tetratricopeptide (TPR) repeat protein